MAEEIIAPVSRELLKAELTPEKRLRATNKSGNEKVTPRFLLKTTGATSPF